MFLDSMISFITNVSITYFIMFTGFFKGYNRYINSFFELFYIEIVFMVTNLLSMFVKINQHLFLQAKMVKLN